MGLNAIESTFRTLRARGETALMPYLTAGFPSLDASMTALRRIDAAGADLIEVGVPFSDPVADGPTIQAASRRALAAGATVERVLGALSTTAVAAPLVLMSYVNPLLAYGRERLFRDLEACGVSGLLLPDVPLEESEPWRASAAQGGCGWIPLVAPTSGVERAARIARSARGFVYHVSLNGTTGVRRELPPEIERSLETLRARTEVPLAVGFGIGDAARVRALSPHCDGVVVGSRIVDAIARAEPLEPLIRELKNATRNPRKETPC